METEKKELREDLHKPTSIIMDTLDNYPPVDQNAIIEVVIDALICNRKARIDSLEKEAVYLQESITVLSK